MEPVTSNPLHHSEYAQHMNFSRLDFFPSVLIVMITRYADLISQQLLLIPMRCTHSLGFSGAWLASQVQRVQFSRFTGSLTLIDGKESMEEVVVRVSWCTSFTSSLTQPEYHREKIRKRVDGEQHPRVAEKDAREEKKEPNGDECRQEERIDRGLAHRNEGVSCYLQKMSSGHRYEPCLSRALLLDIYLFLIR